jgi:hypothetical protein
MKNRRYPNRPWVPNLPNIIKKAPAGALAAPTVSGPLADQALQTGTGVINYSTAGSFTSTGLTFSMTGGGSGISINSSTGVISVDRAAVGVSVYSIVVRATNATGFVETGFTLTITLFITTPVGFRSGLSSGTTGDLYVAKTGSNANLGTFASPKLTIAGAISAAATGNHIKVLAGTYDEQFDLGPKQLILSRYGTDRVIVSGGAPLTGGVACTAADAPEVGPNWANIYKFTVTTASISSGDPRAALVTEGETPLAYTMAWAADPRFPHLSTATSQWAVANSVISQPSANPTPPAGEENNIMGYSLPSLTDLYTQAQIERCYVHWHGYPNVNKQSVVTSYNTSTKVVNFDGVAAQAFLENPGDVYQRAFALGNMLPAMKRGTWGFINNGANTTIYVWPTSPASIASSMKYATRGYCVKLSSNCEIRGIEFTMASSAGTNIADGDYAISAGGTSKKNNIKIINCRTFNTWRSAFNSYGGIWIGNTDDLVIEDTTVDDSFGTFGLFVQGNGTGGQRARIRRILVNGSEKSPARFFNQMNIFISNLFVVAPSGLAAHANKSNGYEGCDKIVYHNCFFGGASGYVTWAETSRIAIIGCYVPVSYKGDNFRAIVDQNTATDTPAAILGQSGASYLLCNTIVPFFVDPNATQSIDLGSANNMEVTYTVAANILAGAVINGSGGPPLDRAAGNYFTTGSVLDATDTVSTNAATYTNHMVGDMSYKAGAPVRSVATTDVSAEIAIVKAWFPDITNAEFDKDIFGNTKNWAAAKPGASNDYDATFGLPPILIEKPSLSGAPVLGGTVGTTPYFIVANPFPTISFKWQNSVDEVTWTDIAGATNPTYVLAAGDVGKYVACFFTGAGISFRVQSSTVVSASYALSDPLLMQSKTFTSGSPVTMQDETATYVSTGKPLMVIASQRAGSAADSTVTCTVGASGRAYGTGTSLTQQAFYRRTQSQSHVFYLLAPSAGTVSVQVQGSLTANSWDIQVFEVGGLTGFGTPSTIGGTTVSSLTSSVTTFAPNGGALYLLTRFDGDTGANPVSTTGSDPISTTTTGGLSATNDLAVSLVYSRVPSAGALAKTFSWPTGRTAGAIGLELKS